VTTRPPDAHSPLVLIVDDNEKNLKLACDVLRANGFRTLEAETGGEAMVRAAEHLPDLILIDLRLPDMDGADAARMLRASSRTARIPIVAMSALRVDDVDWLPAEAFAGFLQKPIDVLEFPDEVRRYCARAGRARSG
jgi:two-component system cell cycle response regulator DivK